MKTKPRTDEQKIKRSLRRNFFMEALRRKEAAGKYDDPTKHFPKATKNTTQ